eukprot:scaffold70112_cov19-Tisochrysis_lutea.AAC.1
MTTLGESHNQQQKNWCVESVTQRPMVGGDWVPNLANDLAVCSNWTLPRNTGIYLLHKQLQCSSLTSNLPSLSGPCHRERTTSMPAAWAQVAPRPADAVAAAGRSPLMNGWLPTNLGVDASLTGTDQKSPKIGCPSVSSQRSQTGNA